MSLPVVTPIHPLTSCYFLPFAQSGLCPFLWSPLYTHSSPVTASPLLRVDYVPSCGHPSTPTHLLLLPPLCSEWTMSLPVVTPLHPLTSCYFLPFAQSGLCPFLWSPLNTHSHPVTSSPLLRVDYVPSCGHPYNTHSPAVTASPLLKVDYVPSCGHPYNTHSPPVTASPLLRVDYVPSCGHP